MSKIQKDELIAFKTNEKIKRDKELNQYKKVVKASLGKWIDNFNKGQIKLNSVNDLKVLIEADKLLDNQKEQ